MLKNILIGAALSSALLVAGCGTNPGDRALSGAGLGAGAGAAIGAVTGGNPATGAAIGAVGGALLGAATDPCDLNMGDPFWRRNGGRDGYERRCGRR